MATEPDTNTTRENWTSSGHQTWELHSEDGYLGQAHWRADSAGMDVTRPDGTRILRKLWGSGAVFASAWPGTFAWLRKLASEEIAADLAKVALLVTPAEV